MTNSILSIGKQTMNNASLYLLRCALLIRQE